MGSAMTLSSLFLSAPEIPLPAAPLELVVAQIRFNPIMSIAAESGFIGPFQEALRHDYPILRPTAETRLIIAPDGSAVPQEGQRVWRFEQKDGPWQIALATDFVAVSTRAYTSRDDFLRRVGVTLEALGRSFQPSQCERIGVRYVSHVVEPALLNVLPTLMRPEVLGIGAIPAAPGEVHLEHSLTDSLLWVDDGVKLRSRWGLLPANATLDATLPPSESPRFVFDFDVYSEVARDYSPLALRDTTARFCGLQYNLFRWAVTDDFLRAYGGDI
jgi:uncharacterized protein (TIGR04255 family)